MWDLIFIGITIAMYGWAMIQLYEIVVYGKKSEDDNG